MEWVVRLFVCLACLHTHASNNAAVQKLPALACGQTSFKCQLGREEKRTEVKLADFAAFIRPYEKV